MPVGAVKKGDEVGESGSWTCAPVSPLPTGSSEKKEVC